MSHRVRVARLDELPEGLGMRVDVAGERIALFRIGTAVYAIGDRCSHAEASLAEGELFGYDVECPRHGSAFDVRDGHPDALPATRPVPVYDAEVVDGEVYLSPVPMIAEEAR